MGLFSKRKEVVVAEPALPAPFSGESYEQTKSKLGAGSGLEVLVYHTNYDRLEIRALKLKADEAVTSQSHLAKHSAREFEEVLTEMGNVYRRAPDPQTAEILQTYIEHSLHRTANAYAQILSVATASQVDVVSRSVSRTYRQ
jgi:hypothetical protein